MRRSAGIILLALSASLPLTKVEAEDAHCNTRNFVERKAYLFNFAPGLTITGHSFCNTNSANPRFNQSQFVQEVSWKNEGDSPIMAFELVALRLDPFEQKLEESSTIIPLSSSDDWSPIPSGKEGRVTLVNAATAHVYTSIVYVRTVRYSDGRVWAIDSSKLLASLKSVIPDYRDH